MSRSVLTRRNSRCSRSTSDADSLAERSYTCADRVATRQAANNPAGLPTYALNAADGNPMAAADYRNGSDIASDTYNGSRRTITIGRGQGPLAAMEAMGFNDQQQRAMYGQLARSGQLSFDGKGTPLVQPGQQLYVDLDDMSGARLGGRLIGAESSKRAALAAAEQRAYWDSLQAGAWSGRTSEGGPVWHAGGTQQVTGSAVDLIPTGGYAYVPAPQSMQPTGWIGKGLELIDDFNNSWAGKAAQGWPQENFAVGGAKAALLFAGTMGRNLPGDAAAVDRVVANVAGEASKIGTVGNAGRTGAADYLSRFSSTELGALRTAGLSDVEIARHVELSGDIHLFRGTSRGWAGSPGAQATAVSATTDPYIATVFALEARGQAGQAVVQFGPRSSIGTFDMGNWMAAQEREVGVLMTSRDFAARAPGSIPVDTARQVLGEMGMPALPHTVASPSARSMLLDSAPKMTPEQVAEFLQRINKTGPR